MFNWVVKVVPQPPDAGTDDAAKTPDAVRQHTHTHTQPTKNKEGEDYL